MKYLPYEIEVEGDRIRIGWPSTRYGKRTMFELHRDELQKFITILECADIVGVGTVVDVNDKISVCKITNINSYKVREYVVQIRTEPPRGILMSMGELPFFLEFLRQQQKIMTGPGESERPVLYHGMEEAEYNDMRREFG